MAIWTNPFLIGQTVYAPNGTASVDYSQQPKNQWAQEVNSHINQLETQNHEYLARIEALEAQVSELMAIKGVTDITRDNWDIE